jgi:hypothetical protein
MSKTFDILESKITVPHMNIVIIDDNIYGFSICGNSYVYTLLFDHTRSNESVDYSVRTKAFVLSFKYKLTVKDQLNIYIDNVIINNYFPNRYKNITLLTYKQYKGVLYFYTKNIMNIGLDIFRFNLSTKKCKYVTTCSDIAFDGPMFVSKSHIYIRDKYNPKHRSLWMYNMKDKCKSYIRHSIKEIFHISDTDIYGINDDFSLRIESLNKLLESHVIANGDSIWFGDNISCIIKKITHEHEEIDRYETETYETYEYSMTVHEL